MRAIVFSNGEIQEKEVAQSPLAYGWVRIKVAKVGLCGSDVAKFSEHHLPIGHADILGHEFVGQVVELNGPADSITESDRVVCMPILPCGNCYACSHGQENLCSKGEAVGRTRAGAFAEYVDVPIRNAINIPTANTLDPYVLVDPLAVCLHAIKLSGDSVARRNCLVIGDGTIGCLLAWLLRQQGHNVLLRGTHPENLQFIESFGIGSLAEAPTGEFDAVYEAVGRRQEETLSECLRAARRGGQVVVLGVFTPGYHYPLIVRDLFIREIRLQGSNAYVPVEFNETVSIVGLNTEAMTRFISHRFSLSRLEDALEVIRKKNGFTMKIVLELDGIVTERKV